MVEGDRPVYCQRCGSIVQAGDRFCGVCGAQITASARDTVPTEEIPSQAPPPPSIPSRSRLPIPWWVVGMGALVVLVLGIGVVAVTASSGETIEPLPGVSAEVPEGWVISSDSNQSGRIGSSSDAIVLIPEACYDNALTADGSMAHGSAPYLVRRPPGS